MLGAFEPGGAGKNGSVSAFLGRIECNTPEIFHADPEIDIAFGTGDVGRSTGVDWDGIVLIVCPTTCDAEVEVFCGRHFDEDLESDRAWKYN